MDKKTFIKELERSLSVLQEDELRDIVGEYEQHIDMKVQSGLTEEEAIADFGSLSQLSAEILEAYHVRADYAAAEKEKGKRFSFAEGEKASKEILEQTGELCAKTGRQTVRGLRKVGLWLWGVLLFWKTQISRPIAWMKQKLASYRDQREESAQMQACEWEQTAEEEPMTEEEHMTEAQRMGGGQTADMKQLRQQDAAAGRAGQSQNRIYAARAKSRRKSGRNMIKSVLSGLLGVAAGAFQFCWKAAGWCICAAWNLCWAGFSIFCGVMGLFCLFGLGMLVVLLTQGYPLAGVVIGCLGLNLCLFAAAGFGMTLIWRKKKENLSTAAVSGNRNMTEREAEQTAEPTSDLLMDQAVEVRRLEGEEHA